MTAILSVNPDAYLDYAIEDGATVWWVNAGPGEIVDRTYPRLEDALRAYATSLLSAARAAQDNAQVVYANLIFALGGKENAD